MSSTATSVPGLRAGSCRYCAVRASRPNGMRSKAALQRTIGRRVNSRRHRPVRWCADMARRLRKSYCSSFLTSAMKGSNRRIKPDNIEPEPPIMRLLAAL